MHFLSRCDQSMVQEAEAPPTETEALQAVSASLLEEFSITVEVVETFP